MRELLRFEAEKFVDWSELLADRPFRRGKYREPLPFPAHSGRRPGIYRSPRHFSCGSHPSGSVILSRAIRRLSMSRHFLLNAIYGPVD